MMSNLSIWISLRTEFGCTGSMQEVQTDHSNAIYTHYTNTVESDSHGCIVNYHNAFQAFHSEKRNNYNKIVHDVD